MSSDEITAYLEALDEPKRAALQKLRETIAEVIPEAEQGLSYTVPAFRLDGKVVAGFAAFKNHLSYLPHSGSVFLELEGELAAYSKSKGALALRDRRTTAERDSQETHRRTNCAGTSQVVRLALHDHP
jgi:uncharacterized protein YdhG (YjbR/CyaY superfamily)